MTTGDLHEFERIALSGDTPAHQAAAKLADEVRRLLAELADPRFLYGNTRINRQAIVYRDWQADQLREQVRLLTKKVEECTCQAASPSADSPSSSPTPGPSPAAASGSRTEPGPPPTAGGS